MSTGTWQPANDTPSTIDSTQLHYLAAHCDNAAAVINTPPYSELHYVMKKDANFWRSQAADCSDATLWQLIKFFALAEEADAHWSAGEHSPAIHLNKMLKQRGVKLTKEQLLWLRENSTNRFIPNGPITL